MKSGQELPNVAIIKFLSLDLDGNLVTISYRNPIIRGTEPDPSIVRVDQDYYLATSSFDMLPGILIRHSTDLINWQIIGAAVTRPSQYRRDGQPGPVSLFAPTLRFADGTFFLACTNVEDGQGNFVLRTTDPFGEWSDAMWLDNVGFDPSLFRDDDGTWYYTRRSMQRLSDGRLGPLVQAVLDMDTGSLGEFRPITPGHAGFCSNDIEGPHLYKVGSWYYLLAAEGGTWSGHMETCARSRSPWGPFEPAPHNPVLTHRNLVGHPIQSLGHVDIVDDIHGNWWAVGLGTRHTGNDGFVVHHNLGRETFLIPVEWREDWPVFGDGGSIQLDMRLDRPSLPESRAERGTSLHLDGWRGVADLPRVSRQGVSSIVLRAGKPLDSIGPGVGAALISQKEDHQVFEVNLLEVSGADAGIAVYADGMHYFSLRIVQIDDHAEFLLERRADDIVTRDTTIIRASPPIRLAIVATEQEYSFEVVTSDGKRIGLGSGRARLISAEAAEWFVGAHFALTVTGEAPGYAVFDNVILRETSNDRDTLTSDRRSHLVAP